MKIIKDIAYSNDNCVQKSLDIYLPESDNFPTFFYLHGGGLESGSKEEAAAFAMELANKGIAVVSADYRMYPDAVYPDFINDSAEAIYWTKQNMKSYGADSRLYIGGSSAGGYLSMMLCFDKKYLAGYNIDADEINGFIFNAGQPTVHFNVLKERGTDSRRVVIDEAAPLYHVLERPYPPMLVIVSDNDIENRYEQTVLLCSTLKQFGCDESKVTLKVMTNTSHCSYIDSFDDKGNSIFAEMISSFING